MSLRAKIKAGDRGIFYLLKRTYYFLMYFSIPAPKIVSKPMWLFVNVIRQFYYWAIATFWVTPLYKGLCSKVGKYFKAGSHLPFVIGKGRIIIGNNVHIYGKVNFIFGSIRSELPEIYIGDNTTIGHEVTFDISGKLEIGKYCLIASGVTIQDCAGHSIHADDRMARKPPIDKDVRPIRIGDNVWVGDGVYIMPGTKIGDACVISAKTTLNRSTPPNHIIFQQPFKAIQIRKISNIV